MAATYSAQTPKKKKRVFKQNSQLSYPFNFYIGILHRYPNGMPLDNKYFTY